MNNLIVKKWRCVECGFVHRGDYPPDVCPVCYATRDAFIEAEDA